MSNESEFDIVDAANNFVLETEKAYLRSIIRAAGEVQNKCGCLHCEHVAEERREKLIDERKREMRRLSPKNKHDPEAIE